MKLFYSVLVLLVLIACTVQTNIHFNEDFSGSLEYVIDMSAAASMMDDSIKNESIFEEEDIQETIGEFQNIDGISNVTTTENVDSAIYKISMDFNSIETLNTVLSTNDPVNDFLPDASKGENNPNLHFEHKKNKLYIHMMDLATLQREFRETADSDDYIDMGELFTYQLNFTFEQDLKKVKTKGAAAQKGNKIEFSLNMDELIEMEELDQDIKVVF